MDTKRLFFGIEVHAPWPETLPRGRLLDSAHRHLTLAFLGNISYSVLQKQLKTLPEPDFKVGLTGQFEGCLALPHKHPHVIAWSTQWLGDSTSLSSFQKNLTQSLKQLGYAVDMREWLPHVTMCREPFDAEEWKKHFVPLPFFISSLHLYESTGNLVYLPLWSHIVRNPFEEIDHTADIAFNIYGETLQQIYHHAFIALAFKMPYLLNFFKPIPVNSVEEIVKVLNSIVSKTDGAVGCPMKAVSYHGEIICLDDKTLQWEMIVDV